MTVTEQEKERLKTKALQIGAIFSVVGVFLMFIGWVVPHSPDVAVTGLIVGVGFIFIGGVFLTKGAEFGENFVIKKRSELIESKEGIVWVWIVALLTWAIMAIAYFSLSMVVYMVLDSVEAFYPWGDQELGVLSLTRNVCAWFLIIMTVGILGWALINSVRKVDDTAIY